MESLLNLVKELAGCIPWISMTVMTYMVCLHGPKSFEISIGKFSLKYKR